MRPFIKKTTTTESTLMTSLSRTFTKEEKYPVSETTQPRGYPVKSGQKFTAARKLQALRQYVLGDQEVSAELAYYVPSNGQSSALSTQSEPLQPWIEKEFLHSDARVLLLKAPGGAGKSTFNRHLLRQLWQDPAWAEWKPGEVPPKASMPVFIPLGSSQVNPKRLLAFLSDLPEPLESFTDEEINVLKEDYHLLLIADGYDEIPGGSKLNLYDVNGLDRYAGRVKLLISSRDFIGRDSVESYQLVPHHKDTGRAEYRYYRERFVSPFTESQIADYLKRYLVKNKERTDISLWPDVATYQKHFKALPELQPLITAPFLLWIAAEALPTIVQGVELELKETQEKEPEIKTKGLSRPEHDLKIEVRDEPKVRRKEITRLRLYSQFMEQWFYRQAEKAIAAKELLEDPEALLGEAGIIAVQTTTGVSGDLLAAEYLKQAYRQFCQLFANHLQASHRTSVQYPAESKRRGRLMGDLKEGESRSETSEPTDLSWAAELFGTTSTDWRRVHKGCPLRQTAACEHQFFHASLIDYFVATISVERPAISLTTTTPQKNTSTIAVTPQRSQPVISPSNQPITMLKSPSTAALTSIPTPTPKPQRRGRLAEPHDPAAQRLLDSKTIPFLVDKLKEEPLKNRYYYDLIERSKTNESIAIAAANAITILNAAGENFSRRDFEGIRIPGANLSGALLDHTNLKGADLTGVSLQRAWMVGSKLSNAKLEGLRIGEHPYIEIEDNGRKEEIWCCRLSPDDRLLAIVASGPFIYLFDVQSHNLIKKFKTCQRGSHSLAWDPSGKRLASGDNDCSVRIWDLDGKELLRLEGHTGVVSSVAWDKNGRYLASGSHDTKIRIWNIETGRTFKCLEGHKKAITSIAWDSQGEQVASVSLDEAVRIWEVGSGKELFLYQHYAPLTQIAWSNRDKRLAFSSTFDHKIYIWDPWAKEGNEPLSLVGHQDIVLSIAWHPSDEYIVSGGGCARSELSQYGDYSVRIWDVATKKLLQSLRGHTGNVCSVGWDQRGENLVSGSMDGRVRIWTVKQEPELRQYHGYPEAVGSVSWDAQGKCLVSAGASYTVRIWEADSGREIDQFTRRTSSVLMVAWSRTGEHLAIGNLLSSGIHIWNLRGGRAIFLGDEKSGDEERSSSCSLAWNPTTNDYLASGNRTGEVKVWDMTTRKVVVCFSGHKGSITSVAWDASGQHLASSGEDGTIRIWNMKTGKEKQCLKNPGKVVNALSWDETGERIVSGDKSGMVRVWMLATGKTMWNFDDHIDHDDREKENAVIVEWDRSGKYIISGDARGFVRVRSIGKPSDQSSSGLYYIHLGDTIKSLSCHRTQEGILLAIAFGSDIACYFLSGKELTPTLRWIVGSRATLRASRIELTDDTSLDSMTKAFFSQQKILGLPPNQEKDLVLTEEYARSLFEDSSDEEEEGEPQIAIIGPNNAIEIFSLEEYKQEQARQKEVKSGYHDKLVVPSKSTSKIPTGEQSNSSLPTAPIASRLLTRTPQPPPRPQLPPASAPKRTPVSVIPTTVTTTQTKSIPVPKPPSTLSPSTSQSAPTQKSSSIDSTTGVHPHRLPVVAASETKTASTVVTSLPIFASLATPEIKVPATGTKKTSTSLLTSPGGPALLSPPKKLLSGTTTSKPMALVSPEDLKKSALFMQSRSQPKPPITPKPVSTAKPPSVLTPSSISASVESSLVAQSSLQGSRIARLKGQLQLSTEQADFNLSSTRSTLGNSSSGTK